MSNKMPRIVITSALEEAQGTLRYIAERIATTQSTRELLSLMECKWETMAAIDNLKEVLDTTKEGE